MFITTANDVSQIPAPLRDRMEIIELDSYTREEKFNIAKNTLFQSSLKSADLPLKRLNLLNRRCIS